MQSIISSLVFGSSPSVVSIHLSRIEILFCMLDMDSQWFVFESIPLENWRHVSSRQRSSPCFSMYFGSQIGLTRSKLVSCWMTSCWVWLVVSSDGFFSCGVVACMTPKVPPTPTNKPTRDAMMISDIGFLTSSWGV